MTTATPAAAAAAETTPVAEPVGFEPHEVRTDTSTRDARLKWVVVVDESLPPGRAVNAAVCVAAATSGEVTGLRGPSVTDADGTLHPGLPWIGCTVLAAPASEIARLRAKAVASLGVHVADMPAVGQQTRVYDEYLTAVSTTPADELAPHAVSIVGPRNRVAKIVGRLPLMA
ncbi:DUF2000 domain-containing protein [Xylanimonas oleitrophica]|uniref:DUF2000 domain-containing protein n=1 Tax=Xylanimonas oleitrophica TaxID=2607479 RepID=A0A2W5Y3B0_9MICO|nr:DUF2000 domain-containing protein [Xylanimonas oleitrophica]PZR52244.1 DUF2000 domain-containing protein [Xylanimonas oleitrophica]